MRTESKEKYIINIPFEYYNEDGFLKPQGYQNITDIIGDMHLKETDQQIGSLIAGKYTWVILSLTAEVKKPINNLKPVYGKTWYSERRGPYFRREYQVEDELGNVLFVAASYSVLIDVEKRTVYRQKELPFTIFQETNNYLLEANPTFKANILNNNLISGVVYNSDIDGIGHVNNLKYTEYVYNSFNSEKIKLLKAPFSIKLYFHKEMLKEEQYSVKTDKINTYQVCNETKNEISFSFIII